MNKLLKLICFFTFLFIINTGKAYDFVDNGIAYSITSFSDLACAVVAKDDPYSGSINIPAVVNYQGKELKITSIGTSAFIENTELITVSFGENILSIGNKAFQGCSSLNKIVLNDQLNSIGEYAFANCVSLTQVNLPLSINSISEGAFSECSNLCKINIPESLSIISPSLFFNCNQLQSIILTGVTSIGNSSFENCGNLSAVSLGENLSTIGDQAFKNCNSLNSIIFPENLISIGEECFTNSNIDVFNIPDNVITIGDNAILGCENLKLLSIGAGISTVERSLWGCSKVNTLEFRYNSTELNFKSDTMDLAYSKWNGYTYRTYNGIFKNLDVKNLIINRPVSITRMPHSTEAIFPPFMGNKYLERIEILEGYEYENANQSKLCFANCSNLEEVLINNSNLTIPSTLWYSYSELKDYPFFGYCYNLKKITLDVKGIGEKVFYDCSNLSEVNLFNVVQIQSEAFNGCTSLQYITLPQSIKSLSDAIVNCPLETINILASTPPSSSEFNSSIYLTTKLDVPYGTISSYKEVSPWNNFWNIEELPGIEAEQIILNIESVDLYIGETIQLEATVLPEDTTDKTIIWNSSNENVATVSDGGLITAISKGASIITATCGEVSATCEINVINPIIVAEQIILNLETAELNIGETVQLEATVLPEDTTDKTILWNSSDENVATVSVGGLVTAFSKGTAIINASCGDVSAQCTITVLEDAGVESLLANPDTKISIYATDGILIKKDCRVEELKTLNKGIYIIVSGKEHYKISI